MKRRPDHPQQLTIDWNSSSPAPAAAVDGPQYVAVPSPDPVDAPAPSPPQHPSPLVERLRWDFDTCFPQPIDEAIDAGVLDASDRQPDNLRGLHEDFSRQCLAALDRLAVVHDARRRGVDPDSGQTLKSAAARKQLRRLLADELERAQRGYRILVETYENAFGTEAAAAFDRYLRARQAGIRVVAEDRPRSVGVLPFETTPAGCRRGSALPVPRPLPGRSATGIFGTDKNGRPVVPGPDEVRAITEAHAEKIFAHGDQVERSLASAR